MKDLIIKDTITDLSENEKDLILESFSPVVQVLNDFGKQFPEIQAMETGEEKCKKAKRFRIDFGKQITKADTIRKDLKEVSLKKSKAVQTVFNYIKKATEETKEAALEIETHYERLEVARIDAIREEREVELFKYNADLPFGNLGEMEESVWINYINGVRLNDEAVKEAERKAEAERIEAERIDFLNEERKESILDLWQFMPEENRNVNFGEWAADMWDELVNYLYLAKADYDKEQEKIKADNERLKKESEVAEKKRLADERKLAKKKKDRVVKYSKKLLEAGYETNGNSVYTLGMYRVTDTQLESLTDKEFQDRLTECKKGHERDLQLKKEQEDKDRLKQEANDKATADKKEADQKAADDKKAAAAPDKEKLLSIATKLRNTKTTVKSPEAIKALEDAALLIEKIAGGM